MWVDRLLHARAGHPRVLTLALVEGRLAQLHGAGTPSVGSHYARLWRTDGGRYAVQVHEPVGRLSAAYPTTYHRRPDLALSRARRALIAAQRARRREA